jgi:hypothetical protein
VGSEEEEPGRGWICAVEGYGRELSIAGGHVAVVACLFIDARLGYHLLRCMFLISILFYYVYFLVYLIW